jgi:hypothetical protein
MTPPFPIFEIVALMELESNLYSVSTQQIMTRRWELNGRSIEMKGEYHILVRGFLGDPKMTEMLKGDSLFI